MENTEPMAEGDQYLSAQNQIESESDSETQSESDEISFEDLGLDEITLAAIERKGFVTPSPIQVLAIPRLLNGEANVIARARTGTGKTAAFGLPLVQTLRTESKQVKAIILEPTRELAMQTCTEMASFTTGEFPRTCVVYGGAGYGDQLRSLRRGAEIVVGTPGRVQDMIDRGALDISKIEYFILDEGDEMLDMGFVEDIENIFASANPDSRVLLFSATVPKPILQIAQRFMGDYEIVEEEGHEEEPLLIEQKYWIVREAEKIEALVRLIDISPDFFGLVFVQKKTDADLVTRQLDDRGYQSAALHGDIPQAQREKILARFRAKKTRVLVATDVAARGIDIEGLTHVVNFDLPFDGPTYVHRIGRTGRAGAAGMAVTFVRPEEQRRKLAYLRNAVRKSAKGEMTEGTVPSVEEVLAVKKLRLFTQIKKSLIDESSETVSPETEEGVVTETAQRLRKGNPVFDELAAELCQDQNPQEVVSALLSATYGKELSKSRYGKVSAAVGKRGDRDGRDRGGRDRDGRRERRGVVVGEDQIRLYVQMGWYDGQNPKSIAEFFSKLLHIPGRQVDAIDMSDRFCLLSLPTEAGKHALELSRADSSLPHMHQDTKSGGDDGADFKSYAPRRRRSFSDDRPSRERRSFARDDFGDSFDKGSFRDSGNRRSEFRDRGDRDRIRSRDRDRERSSNGRPNVHTATQRNSHSSYFKRPKYEEY